MKEQVLAVPRRAVPAPALRHGVLTTGIVPLIETLGARADYIDRGYAETTSDWKQLIPYVYLAHGNRVFAYRRRTGGAEAGLWHRVSIGFGGHVNSRDDRGALLATMLECARRELAEEVALGSPPELKVVGLLNDDTDPVGARHLGVVLQARLAQPAVRLRERHALERVGRGFLSRRGLASHRGAMETWSRLLLDALEVWSEPVRLAAPP